MQTVANQISDSTILSLIGGNIPSGWDQLYDKYAPVMYGVIQAHTGDRKVAEQIFMKLFIRLKQNEILLKINVTLCVCILRYTYINTREELRRRGINYTESPLMGNSVLGIFFSQNTTIAKVATKLKISEKEVKQNLHKEFLLLRSKNQHSGSSIEDDRIKENVLHQY